MIPLSAALVFSACLVGVALAVLAARARRLGIAVACVIAIGAGIRAYAASERTLHEWDERYHALVAKHLAVHPLTPTLYDDPVMPYDYRDWTANHVWLHKPPMALWLMAGSLRLFGVSEFAARLPDVLLSTCAVALTFLIGRRLFEARVALLAAGFHAVNGLLVALTTGRAPTDHVDTALITLVELGVLLAMLESNRPRVWLDIALGLTLGAGVLTKWYPAFLILPLWLSLAWGTRSIGRLVSAALVVMMVATAVVVPWVWYIAHAFPREALWEWRSGILHTIVTFEGRQGGPLFYLAALPKFFGELIYVPLAWAVLSVVRRRSEPPLRLLVLWFAIPYVLFSFSATKMPAYVMIAAPAVFLIEAWFWLELAKSAAVVRWRRWRVALLVALALLPARYLLRPGGPFTITDRHPTWVQALESVRDRVTSPRAVLFNVPRPVEAMFYLPWPAYRELPTDEQAQTLTTRGYSVFIFDEASGTARPYSASQTAFGPPPQP